ncbi:hypothetical protein GUJ93_ZPchr0012g20791 [Zizania palustris]|uniref:Uncharacterized protein n=1 Tax=Zizania palustris TaxID=103762 RepID=A0A8J5WNW8_ZIZPA|nr:hypothetical protein GUJ93_ZPchr0012g20791 [Zizania palustris]
MRAEDDRREARSKEPSVDPLPPEFEKKIAIASMEVDDNGLEDVEYMDEEDPTMNVSDTYPTMDAFKMTIRQYAIKGQFDIYIIKSDKTGFKLAQLKGKNG